MSLNEEPNGATEADQQKKNLWHDCLTVFMLACRTANGFKCTNNMCLSNTVMCDGYHHCEDGSDEAEDICGAFIYVYSRLFTLL